jgi:hypothetical protein
VKRQCKKLSLLTILIFLATVSCKNLIAPSDHAPDILWTKTYGGDSYETGYSVQQTSDGGYIIVGSTWSFDAGFADVYLIKTDANGDTVWTKVYGGTNDDVGRSVQQTSDEGFIIVGGTRSFGAGYSDIYLIRTDTNGDAIWTKTFGGTDWDYGRSVQQTSDGGFIVVGETGSFGEGGSDVYLIRTDTNGDAVWTKTYGGTADDYGYSVQQISDGGFIVAGELGSFGEGGTDVYLVKTDANGDTVWTKTYGGTTSDYGYSVQQTSDKGYIIAGETWSFGQGGADIYLIKTDANGDTIWTKTYGGANNDYGYSVQQTSGGGYIIAGETWSFGEGGADVYLIKANKNGNTIWTKTYGGTASDLGYSVKQTFNGGYIIAGKTSSFGAGLTDVYLIKTKP